MCVLAVRIIGVVLAGRLVDNNDRNSKTPFQLNYRYQLCARRRRQRRRKDCYFSETFCITCCWCVLIVVLVVAAINRCKCNQRHAHAIQLDSLPCRRYRRQILVACSQKLSNFRDYYINVFVPHEND